MVRNVSSVGSDMEYMAVFIRDTKGVPKKAAFSDSGLRRDFLGHIFNRKSQPFMCIYKYCMHVIKPMQIPAFMWAERFECWLLPEEKGWDQISKQNNAMYLGSWFFNDLSGNLHLGARCKSKHHFIHTTQPFHTAQTPGSQPSQDDVEMCAEMLLLKDVCKALALLGPQQRKGFPYTPHNLILHISVYQWGWLVRMEFCFLFVFRLCCSQSYCWHQRYEIHTEDVWPGVGNMHARPATKEQKRLQVQLCLLQGTLMMCAVGVQVRY